MPVLLLLVTPRLRALPSGPLRPPTRHRLMAARPTSPACTSCRSTEAGPWPSPSTAPLPAAFLQPSAPAAMLAGQLSIWLLLLLLLMAPVGEAEGEAEGGLCVGMTVHLW